MYVHVNTPFVYLLDNSSISVVIELLSIYINKIICADSLIGKTMSSNLIDMGSIPTSVPFPHLSPVMPYKIISIISPRICFGDINYSILRRYEIGYVKCM